MSIQDLKEKKLILFECISGSIAYGTNHENSDTDIRGVFYQPLEDLLVNNKVDQVNDETNDTTYYEIGRFLELLVSNNPNILELLNVSPEHILYKSPIFDIVLNNKDKFVSKLCAKTFAGYAITQIKKARGLNKKIVNPVDKKRKSPLDFCYAIVNNKSIVLTKYLKDNNMVQEDCGITKIPNAKDLYSLFYEKDGNYRGIVKNKDGEFVSNQLRLSSTIIDKVPVINISYNQDGYIKWCKDYKEYWSWVEKRNKQRYNDNETHGGGYDSKNMMHCHRLLDMSIEILSGRGINVRRGNVEELLRIKKGLIQYDELLNSANEKIEMIEQLSTSSNLSDEVDTTFSRSLLLSIRKKLYNI